VYTARTTDHGQAYQLLAHGMWFSPGIPASSTTKTGRHDIADILLKVALSTNNHHRLYEKKDKSVHVYVRS
jgi:hypothetical protein